MTPCGSWPWLFSSRLLHQRSLTLNKGVIKILAPQTELVHLSDKRSNLPNPLPLSLVIGNFFLSCLRCHPQKLKSLRDSPTSLNLAQAISLAFLGRVGVKPIVAQLFHNTKRLQVECGRSLRFWQCRLASRVTLEAPLEPKLGFSVSFYMLFK